MLKNNDEIGIKRARYIVAKHYGVDPKIRVSKLFRYFERQSSCKARAVVIEAKRIEALRTIAGADDQTCRLCGWHDNPKKVSPRADLSLKVPKFLVRKGWPAYNIKSPLLCSACWRVVSVSIHKYRILIDTYRLTNRLERTRKSHD